MFYIEKDLAEGGCMNRVTLHQGHVLPVLQTLPDESVQCVVTSPPYWGLRDYGVEAQVWGGEAGCGHEWGEGKTITTGRNDGGRDIGGRGGNYQDEGPRHDRVSSGSFCRLCNAWRGSYGLEPTIEMYVEHTVAIFREVRRVLRKDGVLFLNLGDSYVGGGRAGKDGIQKWGGLESGNQERKYGPPINSPGLKPKDLCGIPWRVALALQAGGWWLRSDIIWAKPNPMPESCTDRPTTAHEHIFLLTKAAHYFYDADAVREPAQDWGTRDRTNWRGKKNSPGNPQNGCTNANHAATGRNLRTVWTIATAPFPQAHFATYPPELVRRCVAAGTSEKGCCPKCGAAWKRVVEKKGGTTGKSWHDHKNDLEVGQRSQEQCARIGWLDGSYSVSTTGWAPTCTCPPSEPIPCTVLDPFSGAGTTALVAAKMGRDAIGIELNPEYVEMSRKRIAGEMGMLVEMILEDTAKWLATGPEPLGGT